MASFVIRNWRQRCCLNVECKQPTVPLTDHDMNTIKMLPRNCFLFTLMGGLLPFIVSCAKCDSCGERKLSTHTYVGFFERGQICDDCEKRREEELRALESTAILLDAIL